MILPDHEIKKLIKIGKIKIEPIDEEIQIQPSSVDLRLGNEFIVFKHLQKAYIDPFKDNPEEYTEKIYVKNGSYFILHPGEFILGTTKEWIEIPNDIVARIEGRSSLGRLAILVHVTAGFIDPGFKGRITLELTNLGKMPVALYPGMRICQISFYKLTSSCEIPYGDKRRDSKYQYQTGAAGSKIFLDKR